MKTARALLLALASTLGLGGASHAQSHDALTIGISQFPSTLHPMFDSMAAKSYVLAMARRPLTTYDKDWNLVCLMCETLPTFENGGAKRVALPDGKEGVEVVFRLKDGFKWGDGTPVSPRDAILSWEIGRHPRSGVAGGEGYRRIVSVVAKDAHTIAFTSDRVTFTYNDFSQFEFVPDHVERRIFESDPENYRRRTAFDAEPTNPALFNGPYRIAEVQQGAAVTLVPNGQWGGKTPAFKRVVVRAVENTAALEANLLSGSVDYVAGELGFTLDQALALEKRHPARFDFRYVPGLVYEHIDLNLDLPAFQDKAVRQALILATDRGALVRQLFEDRQPVAASFINPKDAGYAAEIAPYPFDLARAQALLDQAGYTRLVGGVRQNAAGQRLSFELGTTAGNRIRETVQQVLQAQWRRAGIEVRIRNEPARVFFGETIRQRRFQLAMYAWVSAPQSVPRTTLHSESIPTAENNWAGQNQPGIRSAEMDRLIDATERELDAEKRKALWARMQRLYVDEAWVMPLFFRADPFVVPKWLAGLEPTGHQYPSPLGIENWHVR
jgi:peptide/nickel transport system substrate-binding protein